MRRLNRDDDGITIVVVTLGMAAFLLMAALALDVGTWLSTMPALRTARMLEPSRQRSTAPKAKPSTRLRFLR